MRVALRWRYGCLPDSGTSCRGIPVRGGVWRSRQRCAVPRHSHGRSGNPWKLSDCLDHSLVKARSLVVAPLVLHLPESRRVPRSCSTCGHLRGGVRGRRRLMPLTPFQGAIHVPAHARCLAKTRPRRHRHGYHLYKYKAIARAVATDESRRRVDSLSCRKQIFFGAMHPPTGGRVYVPACGNQAGRRWSCSLGRCRWHPVQVLASCDRERGRTEEKGLGVA